MDHSTGFFLDDDELFALFATDKNPPPIKSRLFRVNVSSAMVELAGMKGTILAVRKLRQAANVVQVKLNSGSTIEIEGRLKELGFARCQISAREGFSDFQEIVKLPDGYVQQCDRINVIWRSWWPIKDKTLNGQTAVLVFHEGAWQEIKEVETGVQPSIITKTQHLKIATSAEVIWAIDARFAKGTKVEDRVKHAHASYADERAWANEAVISGAKDTMSQVLQEISATSQVWIKKVKSIDADVSGLLDESSAIDQRKRQLIQALEYLAKIAQ
jgi:hypothetical protein